MDFALRAAILDDLISGTSTVVVALLFIFIHCTFQTCACIFNSIEMELSHMDEFIDELLREERACDVILPRIQVIHPNIAENII